MDTIRLGYCQFVAVVNNDPHDNDEICECSHCGRRLTGNPERYKNTIICDLLGVGNAFHKRFMRLALWFRKDVSDCRRCNDLLKMMNTRGAMWCLCNMQLIVAIVKYNAKKQGYWMPKILSYPLLLAAILEQFSKQNKVNHGPIIKRSRT